jgi:hypothetical protein
MKTTKTRNKRFLLGALAAVLAFIVMGCSSPLDTYNGESSERSGERSPVKTVDVTGKTFSKAGGVLGVPIDPPPLEKREDTWYVAPTYGATIGDGHDPQFPL